MACCFDVMAFLAFSHLYFWAILPTSVVVLDAWNARMMFDDVGHVDHVDGDHGDSDADNDVMLVTRWHRGNDDSDSDSDRDDVMVPRE